ncbi:MAG: 30S ribosome-binding factor RbfA [Candidatus Dadabacteria bacterium]|nr:30S ribosome-binding factor RbfA [Candidatus Dadabacteria bacterium]NIS09749.1 30S ribosome-binding factor RbfA [Candidatus Dadabacteria bacterium]NIV41114.1 30S ribosome-binding factor RbfA [Candidatus Dadabacteria bacterium]NIX16207.1 30S ribosome-binding factor RbfA [Candidatus Dadabacteria bacterium]NIY22830.1 30S ribosome-binding factor RbfA [Candidatus Dadabacteria bacterium]
MGFGIKRNTRVGGLIKEELADMLLRGDIKDPRVTDSVITGVKMTDDLGLITVYFISLTKEHTPDEIAKGFNSAKGFIKSRLSKKLRLKKFPEFRFEYDSSIESGYRVDDLIKESLNE